MMIWGYLNNILKVESKGREHTRFTRAGDLFDKRWQLNIIFVCLILKFNYDTSTTSKFKTSSGPVISLPV